MINKGMESSQVRKLINEIGRMEGKADHSMGYGKQMEIKEKEVRKGRKMKKFKYQKKNNKQILI